MVAYLISRMILLIGVVAVVFAVEWLVVLALGLESTAWTLLAIVGLVERRRARRQTEA